MYSIGFVTFSTAESAKSALEASEDQLILDGRFVGFLHGCGRFGYMGVVLSRTMEVRVPQSRNRATEERERDQEKRDLAEEGQRDCDGEGCGTCAEDSGDVSPARGADHKEEEEVW